MFSGRAVPDVLMVVATLLAATLLAACEHDDPVSTGPPTPTLTGIQNQIFTMTCALSGCHLGDNVPSGLNLTAGQSWDNLVNVQSGGVPGIDRVEPGDPDNSYLVMKLEGASGIVGQRMPLGGNPLSSDQIGAIREWIEAGAEDN